MTTSTLDSTRSRSRRDSSMTEARFTPWAHAAGLLVALVSLIVTEMDVLRSAIPWAGVVLGWERALCPSSWLWTVRFDAHWTTSPFLVAGVLANGVLWNWVAACLRWSIRGRRFWALALLVLGFTIWAAWCLRSVGAI